MKIPIGSADAPPRKLWVRALLMALFSAAFQLSAWLLLCTAIIQLVFTLATGDANTRLREFGGSIGRYLSQIADFVAFRTEELPFPFTDWPSQP
ncbi:DUF4389 domain-containing protein [Ramlibacter sp. AN1015]|uniref:DUF4389 domain-containing protein n=1 Tax=Ramlibacter sp. AN1015 TaxID=3133428 RepID=UPI0030BCF276